MKKLLIATTLTLVLLVMSSVSALALTVDTIGVTSTAGETLTTWSYLGTNPRIIGTADPDETVTISIDGTAYTTTADADGDWSYTPTTLTTAGDYEIEIDSGTESISFTLEITTASSTTSTSTESATTTTTTTSTSTGSSDLTYPETLPETGIIDSTVILLGGGLALVLMGVVLYWKVIPALLLFDPEEK